MIRMKFAGGDKMSLSFVDRSGWNSIKYDSIYRKYGKDVIPAWIADMDVATAPEIIEEFYKRVSHGAFGYTFRSEEYYSSIVNWYRSRYNFELQADWIVDGIGVIPMISILVNALTDPGDKIIIQPPVYPPFFSIIRKNNRTLVENRLVKTDSGYVMDIEHLKRVVDSRTKAIILCNPHNPVGRAWTLNELSELYKIAIDRNLIIISDEIHGDIIYSPDRFTTILKAGLPNVIVLNSPGKTFNMPGLNNSYGIIPDENLRKRYLEFVSRYEIGSSNIFGITGLQIAYSKGSAWVDKLLEHLLKNRNVAYEFLRENCPLIDVNLPQATFLMWLDCHKLNLQDPQRFFLEKARVYMNNGKDFGDPHSIRLNFACSTETLIEILSRIKKAYDSAL